MSTISHNPWRNFSSKGGKDDSPRSTSSSSSSSSSSDPVAIVASSSLAYLSSSSPPSSSGLSSSSSSPALSPRSLAPSPVPSLSSLLLSPTSSSSSSSSRSSSPFPLPSFLPPLGSSLLASPTSSSSSSSSHPASPFSLLPFQPPVASRPSLLASPTSNSSSSSSSSGSSSFQLNGLHLFLLEQVALHTNSIDSNSQLLTEVNLNIRDAKLSHEKELQETKFKVLDCNDKITALKQHFQIIEERVDNSSLVLAQTQKKMLSLLDTPPTSLEELEASVKMLSILSEQDEECGDDKVKMTSLETEIKAAEDDHYVKQAEYDRLNKEDTVLESFKLRGRILQQQIDVSTLIRGTYNFCILNQEDLLNGNLCVIKSLVPVSSLDSPPSYSSSSSSLWSRSSLLSTSSSGNSFDKPSKNFLIENSNFLKEKLEEALKLISNKAEALNKLQIDFADLQSALGENSLTLESIKKQLVDSQEKIDKIKAENVLLTEQMDSEADSEKMAALTTAISTNYLQIGPALVKLTKLKNQKILQEENISKKTVELEQLSVSLKQIVSSASDLSSKILIDNLIRVYHTMMAAFTDILKLEDRNKLFSFTLSILPKKRKSPSSPTSSSSSSSSSSSDSYSSVDGPRVKKEKSSNLIESYLTIKKPTIPAASDFTTHPFCAKILKGRDSVGKILSDGYYFSDIERLNKLIIREQSGWSPLTLLFLLGSSEHLVKILTMLPHLPLENYKAHEWNCAQLLAHNENFEEFSINSSSIFTALHKRRVSFENANEAGASPAFTFATNGKFQFLDGLIKHWGVNKNMRESGFSLLHGATFYIISKLNSLQKSHLEESISIEQLQLEKTNLLESARFIYPILRTQENLTYRDANGKLAAEYLDQLDHSEDFGLVATLIY